MLPNTNGFSFVLSINEAIDKFLTASDVCCGVNPCFRVITGAFLHKRENWKNIFFVPPDPEYSSSASRLQSVTPFIWNIAFYFEKSEWWETQAISPLAPFERNGNMVHYGRLLCLRHLFPYILYIYIYIYIYIKKHVTFYQVHKMKSSFKYYKALSDNYSSEGVWDKCLFDQVRQQSTQWNCCVCRAVAHLCKIWRS